jgi:hypothetical protein
LWYCLDNNRESLTNANAERGGTIAHTLTAHLSHKAAKNSRTTHSKRVPNGNSAAVDVYLVLTNAEFSYTGKCLGCEGLIDLEKSELADTNTSTLASLLDCADGSDSHDTRIDTHGT